MKPPTTFHDVMAVLDKVLVQLKQPRVHDKKTVRFAVDHVMTSVAGLTDEQRQQLEEKRKAIDLALGLHERGN